MWCTEQALPKAVDFSELAKSQAEVRQKQLQSWLRICVFLRKLSTFDSAVRLLKLCIFMSDSD